MAQKKRILIIEDENRISDIVTLYLDREGFISSVASTGQEGLRPLKESQTL